MTPRPQHSDAGRAVFRHAFGHGRTARRSVVVLAAALVAGAPLMAHALTESPTPDASAEPVTVPVERDVPAITTLPELGLHLDDPVAEPERAVETVPVEPPVDGLPTDTPPVLVLPPGPAPSAWAALRDCESGGDYSITNPSGKYRGAYQFDRSTWNSVAERHAPVLVGVDPAAASPADQDAMALALYSERGARPWPQCGRALA